MARDKVGRCLTSHGKRDYGCLVAALNQKIVHWVRWTGLERHLPNG